MDLPHVIAIWLHTVAFVIAWGYYGILRRIVLPGLARSVDLPRRASAVVEIEGRALPLIGISLVLFTVTGVGLLVADPDYRGLGNVFATTWSTLMCIKHGLVIALVVLGVVLDRLVRTLPEAAGDAARASTLHRVRLCAEGATALGALIALCTALAQAAA